MLKREVMNAQTCKGLSFKESRLRIWPAFASKRAPSRVANGVLDPLSRHPTVHQLAPAAIESATVCCTASVFCRFLQATVVSIAHILHGNRFSSSAKVS